MWFSWIKHFFTWISILFYFILFSSEGEDGKAKKYLNKKMSIEDIEKNCHVANYFYFVLETKDTFFGLLQIFWGFEAVLRSQTKSSQSKDVKSL